MDWRSQAACLTVDPELFFPVGNTGPAIAQIARAAVSQLLEQVRAYADGQEVRTKPTRATELPITLLEGRTA